MYDTHQALIEMQLQCSACKDAETSSLENVLIFKEVVVFLIVITVQTGLELLRNEDVCTD